MNPKLGVVSQEKLVPFGGLHKEIVIGFLDGYPTRYQLFADFTEFVLLRASCNCGNNTEKYMEKRSLRQQKSESRLKVQVFAFPIRYAAKCVVIR